MLTGEVKSSAGIKADSALSAWLDLFRWVAAVSVVLGHINATFYVKVASLPSSERMIAHVAYAIVSGFSRPAVMIFFVLSGYLVGGGAVRRFRTTGKFDLTEFAVSRLARLWIVLLPAYVYITCVNYIGIDVLNGSTNAYKDMAETTGNWSYVTFDLACNAAFLQSVACGAYGGDAPLWSLANEFWYYVIFVVIMVGLSLWTTSWRAIAVITVGVIAGLTWIFHHQAGLEGLHNSIGIYFGLWSIGVYAAAARRSSVPGGLPIAAAIFVAAIVLWRVMTPAHSAVSFLVEVALDCSVALPFANLLHQMTLESATVRHPPFTRWHKFLAGFSFSLYVLHFPTIRLYSAFLEHVNGNGYHSTPKDIGSFVYGLSALLICLAVAYVASLVTENYTLPVRKAVLNFVASRPRPVTAPL